MLRPAHLGVANAFAMLRPLPMSDRAFLAALLHRLPLDVLRSLRLPGRPDTVPRWHRG
ncbi:hypothetical protein ACOKM3_07385 [Streptomyces sp. BH106]|uniref:hypothetical protein n=1 Tax=Streptomyces sp. BH106 TaxID=3410409 RepID=UPI003CF051C4